MRAKTYGITGGMVVSASDSEGKKMRENVKMGEP
jgi:hypothetical protein